MSETQLSESYASVSYLQQYQLAREPFAVDADSNQDDFFLLDAERAQRLNMLYHMCQNSELLLVVSGVEGSGKTSLLNKFLEMRTDNWRQCVINATTTTNPDQLLIEIGEGFGLPQDSVNFGSGLEMLQKRLTEMKRSELMPILIIDDAHQLPTASLTILLKLSELADADERLLRIVLFGEPSINEMFNAPELKEVKHRITHTLTMPSLDEKQTLEYIKYRFSVAGLQGDIPFSNTQLKQIYRQSNGIPGLVNQLAQAILLGSIIKNDSGPSLSVRFRSGISILLILGIAATITWFLTRDVIDSLGKSQPDRTAKLETRDLPLLPPSKKIPESQINKSAEPIAAKQATDFDAISGGAHATSPAPITDDKDTITNETNVKLTETTIPPVDTTSIVVKQAIKTDKTTVTKPTAKPLVTQSENVIVVTPPPKVVTKPVPKLASTKKPAAPKPAVKKQTINIKQVKASKKKSWLSQQNPNHFTLQLMGSRKRSSLNLVQRAHKIAAESAIIQTKLKGADWYILIYKSFPSKQQARDAVKKLPRALQLTQPWPRPLKDLKKLK